MDDGNPVVLDNYGIMFVKRKMRYVYEVGTEEETVIETEKKQKNEAISDTRIDMEAIKTMIGSVFEKFMGVEASLVSNIGNLEKKVKVQHKALMEHLSSIEVGEETMNEEDDNPNVTILEEPTLPDQTS